MRATQTLPTLCFLVASCGTPEPESIRSANQRLTNPSIAAADFERQIDADTDFALSLLPKITASQPNLIYSPHSMSTALAMLSAGARGQTATEIEGALHFVLGQGVHPAFNKLDLSLKARNDTVGDPDQLTLRVVNDLWLQRGFSVEAPYLDTLAMHYDAGVRLLDFLGNAEDARATINGWVASQTEDRIQDLFPAGAINGDTRLVLTNAIYFKADWLHGFEPRDTAPGSFTNANGQAAVVPMMKQENTFAVAEGDGYLAAELPYKGEELALLLVMPSLEGRAAFEAGLSAAQLKAIASGLTPQDVMVQLPKLEFDLSLVMNDILAALGMPTAFTDAADFSGISAGTRLAVQKVVHKAFVLVDEEGTEAAAATGVSVGPTSVRPEPKQIKFDHPFYFFLRDRGTGAVLFVGRVNELQAGAAS